ncbi:hypothetical protein ACVBEQ_13480 [Nakamurella sp. GG22]
MTEVHTAGGRTTVSSAAELQQPGWRDGAGAVSSTKGQSSAVDGTTGA